ncbi:hypothetical protein ES703_07982 [subsurface metagenome]
MARFFKFKLPGTKEIPPRVKYEVQLTPEEQKEYGVKMGEGNKRVVTAQEYCELYARFFGHSPADAALLQGKLKSKTRAELEAERAKLQERLDRLNAQMQKTVTADEAAKVPLMNIPPPAEPETPPKAPAKEEMVKPKKGSRKHKKSKARKKK